MAVQIWNSTYQPRRIFGWREILQAWSDTMVTPDCVMTVYMNLNAHSNVNFPLSHFLDFVNHEQEGITWLLFEVLGSRQMDEDIPLDYVREILDHVENLDVPFPTFVGTPSMTIRQYVNFMLTGDELEYVNMMPPLVDYVEPAPYPTQKMLPMLPMLPRPSKITIRVLRNSGVDKNDDLIHITNNYDDTFNVVYTDLTSDTKTKTSYMPRVDVLRYLSNTLRLMTLDMDPFEGVQILMPNAPSVLLGINALTSQTRDLIYDTIECMMDNWPRSAC